MSQKMTAQAERRRRGRAVRKQHREARAALANAWKVGDLVDAVRTGLQRIAEACAAMIRSWCEAWSLSARAIWQALTTPVNGGELPRPRPRPRAIDRPERR